MPEALSDRQRIELALPAYLLFVLTSAPGIFTPHDPTQMDRVEADISSLYTQLRLVSLEPFADLTPKKRDALVRRLQGSVTAKLCFLAIWDQRHSPSKRRPAVLV